MKKIEEYTQTYIEEACSRIGHVFLDVAARLDKTYPQEIIAVGMIGALASISFTAGLSPVSTIEALASAFDDIKNSPLITKDKNDTTPINPEKNPINPER